MPDGTFLSFGLGPNYRTSIVGGTGSWDVVGNVLSAVPGAIATSTSGALADCKIAFQLDLDEQINPDHLAIIGARCDLGGGDFSSVYVKASWFNSALMGPGDLVGPTPTWVRIDRRVPRIDDPLTTTTGNVFADRQIWSTYLGATVTGASYLLLEFASSATPTALGAVLQIERIMVGTLIQVGQATYEVPMGVDDPSEVFRTGGGAQYVHSRQPFDAYLLEVRYASREGALRGRRVVREYGRASEVLVFVRPDMVATRPETVIYGLVSSVEGPIWYGLDQWRTSFRIEERV